MLVNIQAICNTAIDLADMRNTYFIDQSGVAGSELLNYFNLAYSDIYSAIVQANQRHFITEYAFTITGGTFKYALPADFMVGVGVDVQLFGNGGSGNPQYVTLDNLMWNDRNKYSPGLLFPALSPLGIALKYQFEADFLRVQPVPTSQVNAIMYYSPIPTLATSLTSTMNMVPRCDSYISIYMACLMKHKQDSDSSVTALETLLPPIKQEILWLTRNRDSQGAEYVVDETLKNAAAAYPWAMVR